MTNSLKNNIIPKHPEFAMKRIGARLSKQKTFQAVCLPCDSVQTFNTGNGNCLNCTEQPRIAARLLKKKSYFFYCPVKEHGQTEHSVLHGKCLKCYSSNGQQRLRSPTKGMSGRAISRRLGLSTYLAVCEKHGQTEHSVLHGKCLTCFTTLGAIRKVLLTRL